MVNLVRHAVQLVPIVLKAVGARQSNTVGQQNDTRGCLAEVKRGVKPSRRPVPYSLSRGAAHMVMGRCAQPLAMIHLPLLLRHHPIPTPTPQP